jgi:hypothetical protein
MANKALDILYNWAKSTGYQKSPDDFYNLISTNKDAFNRVYNYAKETGYERDENAFAGLVGLQEAAQQEMPATETAQSQQQTAYQSDINKGLMPMTESTTVRDIEPEEPALGKPKKKYGKKQDVRIEGVDKDGYYEEQKISTDSPEYRKAYEEGRILPLDEEGMPYIQSTKSVEVIDKKPTWVKQKEANEKLIPALKNIPNDVYYETIVKPAMSNIDAVRDDTRNELLAIYNSEGYINKLRNEIEKSGITDKKLQDVLLNRVVRLVTTPMEYRSVAFDKNTLGEMTAAPFRFATPNPFSPYDSETEIALNKKHQEIKNDPKYTAIEEYEHASHILPSIKGEKKLTPYNITPYAEQIIEKYNRAKDEYLREPTEVIAKKRATEVYLINKGLLSPGGFVDDSHYDYLLSNFDLLPNNIQQFLMISSGENADFFELKKEAELKLREDEYNKERESKMDFHTKDYNKKTQDFKKSFKAIMNEIAMNNKQQETDITTG